MSQEYRDYCNTNYGPDDIPSMKQYDPLPLPENPTFDDLLFRRHNDGRVGHLHALHVTHDGKFISVTIGGLNDGTPEAPYEMMDDAGETHAPLTEDGVTELMRAAGQGALK